MFGKRHAQYAEKVEQFIKQEGPDFHLTEADKGQSSCEACGRPQINHVFTVLAKKTGNSFKVGSECLSLLVKAPIDIAKLPARHIRTRELKELIKVGEVLGVKIPKNTPKPSAVTSVLRARRADAAKRAWVTRREIEP